MAGKFNIEWVDGKREPQSPPNPRYPNGIDIDLVGQGKSSCKVDLPYPAKRCGFFVIECTLCRYRGVVSTAGRPDDPRSVKLPCKLY